MILMQQNLVDYSKLNMKILLGNIEQLNTVSTLSPRKPFDDIVVKLLDDVSHKLLGNKRSREFPDVITFGFWIRKASVLQLKKRFLEGNLFRLGRGVVFHVAPSNVAVNFAYSLVAALLCGNVNIVKAPSKEFEQVTMIAKAFQDALNSNRELRPYINIVRYGHDKEINDVFSSMCDVRVIWGGDKTVHQIRESQVGARTTEVAFADRFSIAYIEAEEYLEIKNKDKVAKDFYNDTYLTDQNACTSPRIIFWRGNGETVSKAKELFWKELHTIVKEKYIFQDICAIDKLSNLFLMAADRDDVEEVSTNDNLITRVKVKGSVANLMKWKCHAGFFFEYDCNDIMELKDICTSIACQTISYIGNKEDLMPLLSCGIKGVDRIVPIGSTMDFDLIWDGYNLIERFTRIIDIR